MIGQEAELKRHLRDGNPMRVYLLYGDEPYLTAHYTDKILHLVLGDDELSEFNFQKFDGQTASLSEIASAVETLPMMAERKCVVVQDVDLSLVDDKEMDEWVSLITDAPDTCVLILRYSAVRVEDGKSKSAAKSDTKKGRKQAHWKALIKAVDGVGAVVSFPQPTQTECIRLLMSGAKKRGCEMPDKIAAFMVERCGTSLYPLVNNLDKLCALADGGTITEAQVAALTVETLEAKVFDLSKMIAQGRAASAYTILQTLRGDKEKPVSVLSVLSAAYADWYRVKVALEAGKQPEELTKLFAYGNRAFVLRYAARDVSNMSLQTLCEGLECLAQADTEMKSASMNGWWILDRTVTQLLGLRRK